MLIASGVSGWQPALPAMSDFEIFSLFMMILSMVIAAVTIGYTIGKKK